MALHRRKNLYGKQLEIPAIDEGAVGEYGKQDIFMLTGGLDILHLLSYQCYVTQI